VDLRRALGDVRRYGKAELGAGLVQLERHRIRSMRRDPGAHAARERVLRAVADGRKVLERARDVSAEHLEVDGRPQAELRTGDGRGTAVAAVADRRHTRAKALSCPEAGDVDELLPADPGLPLDVERHPTRR